MHFSGYAGALDGSAANDVAGRAVGGGRVLSLAGAADAIPAHVPGNYVVTKAGVDAMTLAAPTPGSYETAGDDGQIISVFSDTTNAHTITATSLLANGTALKTTATFAAFRGAGIVLRAFNGVWQVMSASNVVLT